MSKRTRASNNNIIYLRFIRPVRSHHSLDIAGRQGARFAHFCAARPLLLPFPAGYANTRVARVSPVPVAVAATLALLLATRAGLGFVQLNVDSSAHWS